MYKSVQLAIGALALSLAAGGAWAAKGGKGAQKDDAPVMSQPGKENTNRNNGEDKKKGLDRAEERMSDQGLEHSKARDAKAKKKAKSKPKPKKNAAE